MQVETITKRREPEIPSNVSAAVAFLHDVADKLGDPERWARPQKVDTFGDFEMELRTKIDQLLESVRLECEDATTMIEIIENLAMLEVLR